MAEERGLWWQCLYLATPPLSLALVLLLLVVKSETVSVSLPANVCVCVLLSGSKTRVTQREIERNLTNN